MTSGTMTPLYITDYTLTSCLGAGRDANRAALLAGRTGLKPCDFFGIDDLTTWVGEVEAVDGGTLPAHLSEYDCRNNRLSWLALQQDNFLDSVQAVAARHGRARVGVFIGTSTSGIHQTELAYLAGNTDSLPTWYRYRTTHNVYSVADFVQRALDLTGIASAISTACSSSAKAFASAHRAIELGLCDAAVVGGVDSLCLTTLYGFNSLQLLAGDICRPFDINRAGISIGEAGGFALLEKSETSDIALLGYGESGDAYHMSSPHPDGDGARQAMGLALAKAGLSADTIDYINLHGTGTRANDSAEAKAVARLFGRPVASSSTKGGTGHTLGAAGIIEAAFSLMAMERSFVPPNLNLLHPDPELPAGVIAELHQQPVRRVLSNSFGFGGNNCSLILGTTS